MKKLKFALALVAIGGMTITSCKKDFFDINNNPNDPETADIVFVLPNAQNYTAYVMGNYFQIWGGLWSQYWTQGPTASQYESWDRYLQTNTETDRPWSQLYSGALSDFDYIEKTALAQGKKNYAAVAMIMKAYIHQYITDVWGDVPFSEALQGASKLTPAYDKQRDVYKGIQELLIKAIQNIDAMSDEHPGAEDVIFGGDMEHWLEMANSIRLKCYLRLAYTAEERAAAKDSVAAMEARGDIFLSSNASVKYTGAQYMANPLNTTINALNAGDGNILASATMIDSLKSLADPRIDVWYRKATTGSFVGQHNGLAQGAGFGYPVTGSTTHTNWSLPGPAVGGGFNVAAGKTAPVYLMTVAEVDFLLAEANARGWMTGSDGKAEYEAAIRSSFTQWGLTAGAANTYLGDSRVTYPAGGSVEDKVKAIITQKWYAFCGSQSIESWTEHRRTGYPSFLLPSSSSVLGSGKFPARFVLPSVELTRNPNAAAAAKEVEVKVWWDQN